MLRSVLLMGAALAVLSACGGGGGLHDFRSNAGGPDAFSVIPNKALQQPRNLDSLPTPTPGGTNLADPNPTGDAISALGGRPSAGVSGDLALVQATSRFGVTPTIRADLDADDASFRRIRGRLAIGSRTSRYFRVYSSMALDAYAVLEQFRAAGIATPTAPPQ